MATDEAEQAGAAHTPHDTGSKLCGIAHEIAGGCEPVCGDAPRPRFTPGTYEAECTEARTYPDPQFRRWVCLLQFSLVPGGATVFGFLNLGNGKNAHAGPRSEYRRAWVLATGSQPRKKQKMACKDFVGRIYEVEIADTTKRYDGRDHPTAEVYSTVKRINKRTYP
jgi:hypothetical protein